MQKDSKLSGVVTRCVISQPRYLPSMQYIERIRKADVFVIYDVVQRVSRGYENRNKLRDDKWLTIPVEGSSRTLIKNAFIKDNGWQEDHRNKIKELYQHEERYNQEVVDMYLNRYTHPSYLRSQLYGLVWLLGFFGIDTPVVLASDLLTEINTGVDQLIEITKMVNCNTYLSGATCLKYGLTHEYAASKGIKLEIDPNLPYKQYGWIHDVFTGTFNTKEK